MHGKEVYPELSNTDLYELFRNHDNSINRLYNELNLLNSHIEELQNIVNNLKGVM